MIVKLLTEHHFEFLSLIGGCRGSSESTLIKMSNCWKSHAAAQIYMLNMAISADPDDTRVLRRLLWIYSICKCSFLECFTYMSPQLSTLNF